MCISLATFQPPKSITTRRGVSTLRAPERGSAAICSARAASAAGVRRTLMKPGPATSDAATSGEAFSASTTAVAISRGFLLSFLAAAIAPLHWKSARSGRSERRITPAPASMPMAAKAAPATSDSWSARSWGLVMVRSGEGLVWAPPDYWPAAGFATLIVKRVPLRL